MIVELEFEVRKGNAELVKKLEEEKVTFFQDADDGDAE